MALRRTELLNIQSITGVATVGIYTCGITDTVGGVGIASTTYIRGVIMHNTGLATATSSLYFYPTGTAHPVTGFAITAHRISRVDLASNETFFFETNYPIVMTGRDKLVVEITTPAVSVGGVGVGSAINYQILGDTDI